MADPKNDKRYINVRKEMKNQSYFCTIRKIRKRSKFSKCWQKMPISALCARKQQKGGNITNDGRSPVVAELKLREGPDGREKGVYVRRSS